VKIIIYKGGKNKEDDNRYTVVRGRVARILLRCGVRQGAGLIDIPPEYVTNIIYYNAHRPEHDGCLFLRAHSIAGIPKKHASCMRCIVPNVVTVVDRVAVTRVEGHVGMGLL